MNKYQHIHFCPNIVTPVGVPYNDPIYSTYYLTRLTGVDKSLYLLDKG